jgi:uncharacterized YigZ family protein
MGLLYRTLSLESKGKYKEKGSKFEAYAYPVENFKKVQQHLDQLRQTHYKARHHCYAYVLGPEANEFRAFDDGEPRHSAGDPILGQIRSFDLTYVLIVVVRYFGGTKLGISGLVNAYREASKQALQAGTMVEKEPSQSWVLTFDYPDMNRVMRLVKELKLTVLEKNFEVQCKMTLMVLLSKLDVAEKRVKLLSGVKLTKLGIRN